MKSKLENFATKTDVTVLTKKRANTVKGGANYNALPLAASVATEEELAYANYNALPLAA